MTKRTTKKRHTKSITKTNDSNHDPFINITGTVQHISKLASYYRVQFNHVDGTQHAIDIPRKLFGGQNKAIDMLLDAGAIIPPDRGAAKELIVAAQEDMGKRIFRLTDRVGWHGTSFVYFGKTFGPDCENLTLAKDANRNEALGIRSGSLKAWRAGLMAACTVSDQMIAAICIAASGALFDIIPRTEPAIYHFHGARKIPGEADNVKSSSGKTLSARVGQSMFGRCTDTDLFGFNMTRNALEEACFSCNNLVVTLDEDGTAGEGGSQAIHPRDLPYMIVGGKGRRRAASYAAQNGLSATVWKVPVITTSEDELDSPGKTRKEGAAVRMVPIPFPPTKAGGTFTAIKSKKKRDALAAKVEKTIKENFGVAMPRYLKNLVEERSTIVVTATAIMNRFVADNCPTGDAWEQRCARKFAILGVASYLLSRWNIAPWTEERGTAAIATLYKQSRSQTVSANQATDNFLETIRRGITIGRFPLMKKGTELPRGNKVWGITRTIAGVPRVIVISSWRFKRLVKPEAAAELVLTELGRRNMLVTGADGNPKRQVLIKALSHKRKRYVCIRGLVPKKKKGLPEKDG